MDGQEQEGAQTGCVSAFLEALLAVVLLQGDESLDLAKSLGPV